MTSLLKQSLAMFLVLTGLTGLIYPAIVTLIAQTVFTHKANGSVIMRDGVAIGSDLIGQQFTDAKYFWSRPSASDPPYNAMAGGGTNQAATNPALMDSVKQRVEDLQRADRGNREPIPVDLVTSSGSGLDPNISPAAALFQAKRVATARNLSVDQVRTLIDAHTTPVMVGLLGQPRVSVLRLNLALDELSHSTPPAR